MVKVNQPLGGSAALLRIGVQKRWLRLPGQDRDQLPPQVERVPHRHVHALARLGAVRVAGITSQHHAWKAVGNFGIWNVVKLVGETVPNFVYRPPHDFLHIQREGAEDALGLGDDVLGGHATVRRPFVLSKVVQFHIEANQMPSLAWQDHQDAVVLRSHE